MTRPVVDGDEPHEGSRSKLDVALDRAAPTDTIRAILFPKSVRSPQAVDASEFSDRTTYKRALRESVVAASRFNAAPLKKALEELEGDGLTIHNVPGDAMFVVEGPAPVVKAAVESDAVDVAALDEDLDVDLSS